MTDLLEIRKGFGYTIRQVSELCEISESFYCMIENGERRPSVETAKKIANVFGFDWTRFFPDKEE